MLLILLEYVKIIKANFIYISCFFLNGIIYILLIHQSMQHDILYKKKKRIDHICLKNI